MALQSLDIKRMSATTVQPPVVREPVTGTVAKLIDVSKCIGCKACQTACMEWNDLRDEIGITTGVYDNPRDLSEHSWTVMRFAEYENPNGNLEWLIRKDGCPFNVPRISKKDNRVYKCTLCSDRVAVGQEPACVKTCPTGAIMFGTKEDMKEQAQDRIVDLKERGFEHAGLYDPQGVGGTHVMYVLHHADQPSLYHGLPDNPRISPLVRLWKGVAKPLALAALALTALTGFFHYTRIGPNEVDEVDEQAAEDEAKREREREREHDDA